MQKKAKSLASMKKIGAWNCPTNSWKPWLTRNVPAYSLWLLALDCRPAPHRFIARRRRQVPTHGRRRFTPVAAAFPGSSRHVYSLQLGRSRGVSQSRRGVDGPITCFDQGHPHSRPHSVPRSGDFFKPQTARSCWHARRRAGTRPVAVRLFGEQPELGAAKHRLVANRELSHVDIRSSL